MNIGLLGFGVVGGGVWELAQENRALNVKKVLVRREAPSLGKAAVQDVEAILRDPDIDTVVEVLGGLHPAYEWICRALAGGKNVVTANKAVISAYYRELTALACENRVALRCTAAVGGGIPWLVNLQRCRRVPVGQGRPLHWSHGYPQQDPPLRQQGRHPPPHVAG